MSDWVTAYDDLARRRAGDRPWVAVNMVTSADGAIAVEGRTKALGGDADRHLFHHLRSLADVILVGAQTVRAERYGPPRATDAQLEARRARGQTDYPRLAIVTRRLDLDFGARLFTEPTSRPIVIVPSEADAARVATAAPLADVLVAGEASVDLAEALGRLDAGFVLCEGGPTLNGELARAGLVDELCLTISPQLVGGVTHGILGPARLPQARALDLVGTVEHEGSLFLRYRRR